MAIFVKNNFKNSVLSVSKYNGTIERAFKIKRGKLNYINSKNIYKKKISEFFRLLLWQWYFFNYKFQFID